MAWGWKARTGGYATVETVAAMLVIVLLMTMAVLLYRSMRLAARVSVAETNLEQVGTAMELYLRQHSSYPPDRSDLTVELAPFVDDPAVFHNPLMKELRSGDTINILYDAPALDELDSPNRYITAMISDFGKTVVVLRTGGSPSATGERSPDGRAR